MSPYHPLIEIDPEGEKISVILGHQQPSYEKYFPNLDIYHVLRSDTPYIDLVTTNIYRAGDGKYFHVDGTLSPFMTGICFDTILIS